jgi:hypothetical protein
MQPNSKFYKDEGYTLSFGELNENNRMQGRGIKIGNYGVIDIGYYENDDWSTGNYITIWKDGEFWVGEKYIEDGWIKSRYTWYYTNGTEKKFGF